MQTIEQQVAIREADATDMPALTRLAQLDSRPLPHGDLIVAETAGQIRAALSVDDRALIADPFVPTAELGELLLLRAAQIAGDSRTA